MHKIIAKGLWTWERATRHSGGSKGVRQMWVPSLRPNSVILMQFSWKVCPINRLAHPPLGLAPSLPSGKSWIRHWIVLIFNNKILKKTTIFYKMSLNGPWHDGSETIAITISNSCLRSLKNVEPSDEFGHALVIVHVFQVLNQWTWFSRGFCCFKMFNAIGNIAQHRKQQLYISQISVRYWTAPD